jgi:two-component system response regulator
MKQTGRTDIEILLVEDDSDDLTLTLFALKKNNLANRIHVARDGEEALDFLFCRGAHASRNPEALPRVIFLDLKLPKVDGLQVLREIKNHPRTKSIPVVVMTSSTEREDVITGYQLGVNSYVQKPVDFERFQQLIGQLGLYWLLANQPVPSPRSLPN